MSYYVVLVFSFLSFIYLEFKSERNAHNFPIVHFPFLCYTLAWPFSDNSIDTNLHHCFCFCINLFDTFYNLKKDRKLRIKIFDGTLIVTLLKYIYTNDFRLKNVNYTVFNVYWCVSIIVCIFFLTSWLINI